MSISNAEQHNQIDRRAFLGLSAGAGIGLLVTACGGNQPQQHGAITSENTDRTEPRATPSPSSMQGRESGSATKHEGLLNPVAQHRAAQIISTFENSTTKIQYDYAENIDDGRGITAGRAGFCSGTGDMRQVHQEYDQQEPHNSLSKYLPALKKIDDFRTKHNYDSDGSTAGLDGLAHAWKQAADSDPAFRKAQDEVVNELYLNPAIKRADAANVHSAVGQLIIFDTILQHGEGDDVDGLPHIMREAEQKFPRKNYSERAWLEHFLQIRKHHLLHAADSSTRQDWIESVDRVHALKTILDSGNTNLSKAMTWNVYGDHYSLPAAK